MIFFRRSSTCLHFCVQFVCWDALDPVSSTCLPLLLLFVSLWSPTCFVGFGCLGRACPPFCVLLQKSFIDLRNIVPLSSSYFCSLVESFPLPPFFCLWVLVGRSPPSLLHVSGLVSWSICCRRRGYSCASTRNTASTARIGRVCEINDCSVYI